MVDCCAPPSPTRSPPLSRRRGIFFVGWLRFNFLSSFALSPREHRMRGLAGGAPTRPPPPNPFGRAPPECDIARRSLSAARMPCNTAVLDLVARSETDHFGVLFAPNSPATPYFCPDDDRPAPTAHLPCARFAPLLPNRPPGRMPCSRAAPQFWIWWLGRRTGPNGRKLTIFRPPLSSLFSRQPSLLSTATTPSRQPSLLPTASALSSTFPPSHRFRPPLSSLFSRQLSLLSTTSAPSR